MKKVDRRGIKDREGHGNPSEDEPAPKDSDSRGGLVFPFPAVLDPPDKPYPANPRAAQDSGDAGEVIPDPGEAFWGNLTQPLNFATIPDRVDNAFTYGGALGAILHGWRIKALSFLFATKNATKIEIAVTRSAIKGVGKGLVFVAPLNAIVDLADVFRKNQIGSAAFYQKYGMAGLGIVGGILGGAAFDAFGLGILASLGLSGIGLFVVAPVFFGLLGAGLFQAAGSLLNQQTRQGSFLHAWYPGSFLDRFVSWVWSWYLGQRGSDSSEQIGSQKQAPAPSLVGPISSDLDDPSSSRRRPPWLYPSYWRRRRRPDGSGSANGSGDDGGRGDGIGGNAAEQRRGAPPVGGVLFENCHTVLTGIEELTGAYWDDDSQSLVLIGRESGATGKRNLALPAMDADHLKVALRAAIRGDSLGVSIDAPAAYRYAGSGWLMPPAGTPFFVSYLGGCERTLTGAIFFESDRIMKCLSMGLHNETGKPLQADVPGFRSTFDLHGRGPGLEGSSWHRFWFVVDDVELVRTVGTDALAFGEVRIGVKTELEFRGGLPGRFDDPLDEQFARHLTSHFDEYAKEFPVFARLKELAKVSSLAQFLIDRHVDLDLEGLLDDLPVDVATPQTTPSLVRSEFWRAGGSVRTYAMSGGVDLGIAPSYREDVEGVANRMRERAFSSRSAAASEWSFRLGEASLHANAIKLGTARKLQLVETDHEFPLVGGLPRLRLERIYESRAGNGIFGPGWTAFVPWSLTVLRGSGKRHETLDPGNGANEGPRPILALRQVRSGNTQVYRPLPEEQRDGKPAWGRVISRRVGSGGVSFEYDHGDLIYEQNGQFVMEQNFRRHYFDQTGRLVEISSDRGTLAKYVWAGNRLERLENQAGQRYSFLYSEQTGEVEEVQISDGQTAHYSYDPSTCLREVHLGARRQFLYAYDLAKRLNEVSDATGMITRRLYYGSTGQLVTDCTRDTFDLPDGGKITRLFAGDWLRSVSEETGTVAEFTYGLKGQLQSVFVRSRSGLIWRLEYGVNGKLRRLFDNLGRATEFECDHQGHIKRVTLSDKTAISAKRDQQGQIVEVTASGDRSWNAIYNADGLLESLSGPSTSRLAIRRSRRSILVITISGGQVTPSLSVAPRQNCLTQSPASLLVGYEFDERTFRRFAGRHRIKRKLAAGGRSITTDAPAGIINVGTITRDSTTETVEFL